MYWFTEDVIMEFLPLENKRRMGYCCWYKGPSINSWAALILKGSSGLHVFLDFLSGPEEFVKE
jgi:hypothetical protein